MELIKTYASVQQVAAGFRELSTEEAAKCEQLITEAGIMIDACAPQAAETVKSVVTCRMVRRALADSGVSAPLGATQGSVSALGYSQSWTFSAGSTGELYISKTEKTMLGVSNAIGCSNPFAEGPCNV